LPGVFLFALLACGQSTRQIDADELAKLLEQPGKVFFLDVREPDEIAKLGSVKGYVNIPLGQLERRLGEVPKDKLIVTL
jgi:rhodanese-related sulfurtransferase